MKITFVMMIVCFFCSVTYVYSAQSTADVPVTAEQKRKARTDILGGKANDNQSEDEYVIGHGDILSVSIYGEGDMAASSITGVEREEEAADAPRFGGSGVRVMMDGRISLKHIGDVEVVGMTLTELADYLKSLYSAIYTEPIVTTTLQQSNSLRYTVMGNVIEPGTFYLDYPLTLVQALARAGSFNEWANNTITVVRKNVKEGDKDLFRKNTLEFDYDDFISGRELEKNIFIQSGDIIVVN